jgi:hypothetical protein
VCFPGVLAFLWFGGTLGGTLGGTILANLTRYFVRYGAVVVCFWGVFCGFMGENVGFVGVFWVVFLDVCSDIQAVAILGVKKLVVFVFFFGVLRVLRVSVECCAVRYLYACIVTCL